MRALTTKAQFLYERGLAGAGVREVPSVGRWVGLPPLVPHSNCRIRGGVAGLLRLCLRPAIACRNAAHSFIPSPKGSRPMPPPSRSFH